MQFLLYLNESTNKPLVAVDSRINLPSCACPCLSVKLLFQTEKSERIQEKQRLQRQELIDEQSAVLCNKPQDLQKFTVRVIHTVVRR